MSYRTQILMEVVRVVERFPTGEVARTENESFRWFDIETVKPGEPLEGNPDLLVIPLSSHDMSRFSRTVRSTKIPTGRL